MVSTFPVSGSKEKYRNALTSKGSKFGRDWLGTYYQMRLASPRPWKSAEVRYVRRGLGNREQAP